MTKANRSRKSQKNRQYNDQGKQDKGPNNDLQNITQKTKDQISGTPGVNSHAPGGEQFLLNM